ncbi:retrotransposon-like protein 1 [Entomophthora muscae]|uniref:Retrotransposon-like protein 1 n=1 Tax=Entomophthora muscae TaxID=34485 RepID=A0ACC2U9P5_9FUNG|nr:retrotransposon-like protein 1 [Entomophthora muscae]
MDSLTKEAVKWNRKYLPTNIDATSRLLPSTKTFSSKMGSLPTPPPGTGTSPGGFQLTSEENLRRKTNKLFLYCGPKDHLFALCPLSKQQTPVTSSTSIFSLASKDFSSSPAVLVIVHSYFSKVKVLTLFDTGANTIFIKKELADTLGLPLYGLRDVKVGKSTYTKAASIIQSVTFDLEGSLVHIRCNSTPKLSYSFILEFLWPKKYLLNFYYIKNKVTFICNNALSLTPLITDTLLSTSTSFQLMSLDVP